MRHLIGASLAAITLLAVSTVSAQTAGEKIGQVSFPISCNPAVQKPFERGVALLHSFWYLESLKAFTAVTQADPDCAMGYWGIAKALHGAGRAAELAGDRETAKSYYVRLVAVAAPADTQRPELAQAKAFLGSK
jgi:hypothetical protein